MDPVATWKVWRSCSYPSRWTLLCWSIGLAWYLRDPPFSPKAKNNDARYRHECTRYEYMWKYRRPPANEESIQWRFHWAGTEKAGTSYSKAHGSPHQTTPRSCQGRRKGLTRGRYFEVVQFRFVWYHRRSPLWGIFSCPRDLRASFLGENVDGILQIWRSVDSAESLWPNTPCGKMVYARLSRRNRHCSHGVYSE